LTVSVSISANTLKSVAVKPRITFHPFDDRPIMHFKNKVLEFHILTDEAACTSKTTVVFIRTFEDTSLGEGYFPHERSG
jgi:hypothetical protein